MAYFGSMKEPKAPAKRICVDRLDALLFHQQLYAGIKGGLGELNGTDIVLSNGNARLAVMQEIGEGASISDDARTPLGHRAINDAVLGDDAGKIHLRDYLDDRRATDPGDPSRLGGVLEVVLVGPFVDADDTELRLEGLRVDAHALDRARGSALS